MTLVHSALVEPVELLRSGVPVDTIASEGTVRLTLAGGMWKAYRWRLIRPGNPPIGEPLEGPLPEPGRVRFARVSSITAEVAGQRYFAPLVTNTSASDVTLEVNPGTAAAVRCNCLVPRGAVRTHVGYYRLYENSAVAAYNSAHPYTGPHADREGFATRVARPSGAVALSF
jgi:hypothetical protein